MKHCDNNVSDEVESGNDITNDTQTSYLTSHTVGVMTYHFVRNFGGVLQAYALKTFLQRLGANVRILDYRPHYVEHGALPQFSLSRHAFRSNATTAYQVLRQLQRIAFGSRQQAIAFRNFQNAFVDAEGQRYRTFKDLQSDPPDSDILICGSDQIWNPSPHCGLDPAYFLAFGGPHVKRVAYAPSFGRPFLPNEHSPAALDLLKGIDWLSCRERSGSQLVTRLTGRDCPTVLDPTLLLDDYPTTLASADGADRHLPARYICCYLLRASGRVEHPLRQYARTNGLPVVLLSSACGSLWASRMRYFPGPIEWLDCMRMADYVITNSFHGTVFSILFRRPFVTLSIGGRKQAYDERSRSLLEILGLRNRMISNIRPDLITKTMEEPIDWLRVWKCLERERNVSRDFLLRALHD